jgi:hypothetical protein
MYLLGGGEARGAHARAALRRVVVAQRSHLTRDVRRVHVGGPHPPVHLRVRVGEVLPLPVSPTGS